jgi:hypothetical protein
MRRDALSEINSVMMLGRLRVYVSRLVIIRVNSNGYIFKPIQSRHIFNNTHIIHICQGGPSILLKR